MEITAVVVAAVGGTGGGGGFYVESAATTVGGGGGSGFVFQGTSGLPKDYGLESEWELVSTQLLNRV